MAGVAPSKLDALLEARFDRLEPGAQLSDAPPVTCTIDTDQHQQNDKRENFEHEPMHLLGPKWLRQKLQHAKTKSLPSKMQS